MFKMYFLFPQKMRWIYAWTKLKCWFVLKHFTPPPFPIHTLNKWRKIASWIIFTIYNPSTLQNKTFSIPRKLTCRVNFQIFPSRPYKENSWTFWNFTVDCRNSYAWESDTEPLYTNTFLNIYMYIHSGHTAHDFIAVTPRTNSWQRSHRFLQQAMQTTKHDCTNRWNMVKLNQFCKFTLKTIYSSKPNKSWLFKKQKNNEKNAKIQAIWSNTSKTMKKNK